jgi:hypothetical protein
MTKALLFVYLTWFLTLNSDYSRNHDKQLSKEVEIRKWKFEFLADKIIIH